MHHNIILIEQIEKKICEIIYWSRCITTNHMYQVRNLMELPTEHDNVDFMQIITRTYKYSSIICQLQLIRVTIVKISRLLVREDLHAFSIIPARYEHVPMWRTHGKYRKQMKRRSLQLPLQLDKTKMKLIISVQ